MYKRARVTRKKKLQSREDTAEDFDVNIRTIDRLIKRGKIEAVQVGRRVMVKCESAERFLAGE
jgi:excisionase family DNA binding protein